MSKADEDVLIRRSEALGLDRKSFTQLIDAVNRGQAWYGLVAAVTLRESLDRTIAHLVGQCRSAGISWARIGDLLGVSKQAVQQKYGNTD